MTFVATLDICGIASRNFISISEYTSVVNLCDLCIICLSISGMCGTVVIKLSTKYPHTMSAEGHLRS